MHDWASVVAKPTAVRVVAMRAVAVARANVLVTVQGVAARFVDIAVASIERRMLLWARIEAVGK